MRNSRTAPLLVGLLLCLGGPAVHAEPPNAQAALARAQSMLRQLNDAKQQLELENAKLKASNAALEQQLKHAKLSLGEREGEVAARSKELEGAKGGMTRLETRNGQLTARLEEVVAKYKESARGLQQAEADKLDLERSLNATRVELADAEKKNLALYEISREVLTRFKHKPRWTAVLQKEPFTGLKQVEIETAVQDYERAMEEQLREGNLEAAQAGGETVE